MPASQPAPRRPAPDAVIEAGREARPPLAAPRFRVADLPDQRGRTIMVTGANNGLGLRAVTALAGAGARVVLACRDLERGARALESVRAASDGAGSGAEHVLVRLDLADLSSVRAAAAETAAAVESVDVLINNAGVMAVPKGTTADGFETQFGTNHLGHFALTDAMLPLLLRAGAPRVVTLASIAHLGGTIDLEDPNFERRPYERMAAYQQSKLANLIFSAELARRAAAAGSPLVSIGAHPGVAATNLFDTMLPPIPGLASLTRFGMRIIVNSEADGALSQLYGATMPDVDNGDYLGPDRLRSMRGPVTRCGRSHNARDPRLARRLWELSVEMTGADYAALRA
ncbi:oxidoreductase [Rhodococcus daqingensis]|uniref:Oxidoreductase n=1 Tax=Rhodococcus daqingensis TaxID=2479363 RepID=A0ABW2S5J3_9NOCA